MMSQIYLRFIGSTMGKIQIQVRWENRGVESQKMSQPANIMVASAKTTRKKVSGVFPSAAVRHGFTQVMVNEPVVSYGKVDHVNKLVIRADTFMSYWLLQLLRKPFNCLSSV